MEPILRKAAAASTSSNSNAADAVPSTLVQVLVELNMTIARAFSKVRQSKRVVLVVLMSACCVGARWSGRYEVSLVRFAVWKSVRARCPVPGVDVLEGGGTTPQPRLLC